MSLECWAAVSNMCVALVYCLEFKACWLVLKILRSRRTWRTHLLHCTNFCLLCCTGFVWKFWPVSCCLCLSRLKVVRLQNLDFVYVWCLQEDQESLPYLSEDWPTKDECDLHVQKFPTWNEFPTTYLSPENKGFE